MRLCVHVAVAERRPLRAWQRPLPPRSTPRCRRDLEVAVPVERHAAFEALLHLAGVVFEALERGKSALPTPAHGIAARAGPSRCVRMVPSITNAPPTGPDLGDVEALPDLRLAERFFPPRWGLSMPTMAFLMSSTAL